MKLSAFRAAGHHLAKGKPYPYGNLRKPGGLGTFPEGFPGQGSAKDSFPGSKTPRKSIKPRFDEDFTVWTKFKTTDGGTIFANCAARGRWSPGAKALLVRGQRLVYDIGWVGDIEGGGEVNDGNEKPYSYAQKTEKWSST